MNAPDPFPFEDFLRAQSLLRDAIERRSRYLLLTGESGSGKTTLLRTLRQSIDRCRFRVVYFNLSRLSPAGLVRVLARTLRMPVCRSQPETVQAIAHLLAEEPSHTLIWTDEAQLLPDETFAELRTLAEADLDGDCPLSVLLTGLPSLRERLQAPHLFPLWRRLLCRVEITGLRRDEAQPFATHHLGEKSADRIDEDALSLLFEHARGIPGLLLPYLERTLQEAPEGPVGVETAEAILQRWDLA